ncbi:hypothetical protein LXL04_002321 [Taraxacum kok-saghyz]
MSIRGAIEEEQMVEMLRLLDPIQFTSSRDFAYVYIDEVFLVVGEVETRWNKYMPINVNMFVWLRVIACWIDLSFSSVFSIDELFSWIDMTLISKNKRYALEVIVCIGMWNNIIYNSSSFPRNVLFDKVVMYSFEWFDLIVGIRNKSFESIDYAFNTFRFISIQINSYNEILNHININTLYHCIIRLNFTTFLQQSSLGVILYNLLLPYTSRLHQHHQTNMLFFLQLSDYPLAPLVPIVNNHTSPPYARLSLILSPLNPRVHCTRGQIRHSAPGTKIAKQFKKQNFSSPGFLRRLQTSPAQTFDASTNPHARMQKPSRYFVGSQTGDMSGASDEMPPAIGEYMSMMLFKSDEDQDQPLEDESDEDQPTEKEGDEGADLEEDDLVDEENKVPEVEVDMADFTLNLYRDESEVHINGGAADEEVDEDLDIIDNEGSDDDMRRRNVLKNLGKEKRCNLGNVHKASFYVGQKFKSKKELKDLIDAHAIQTRKNLYFEKNDKLRLRAKCRGVVVGSLSSGVVGTTKSKDKCVNSKKKALHASRSNEESDWFVKTLKDNHSCLRSRKLRACTATFLSKEILSQIETDPRLPLRALVEHIESKYEVGVSMDKIFRAKAAATKIVVGDYTEQYEILRDYCLELQATNPGTTIKIDVYIEPNPSNPTRMFKRIYICLGPLKQGFKACGRDILGFDGAFVKGPFPGQVLTAVGLDSNNGIYPVAYAIVESENIASWKWFLDCLGDDLDLGVNSNFTFIADRQKMVAFLSMCFFGYLLTWFVLFYLLVISIDGLGQCMSFVEYRSILKYDLMIHLFPLDEIYSQFVARHVWTLLRFIVNSSQASRTFLFTYVAPGLQVNYFTDPLNGKFTLRPTDVLKHASVDLTGVSLFWVWKWMFYCIPGCLESCPVQSEKTPQGIH